MQNLFKGRHWSIGMMLVLPIAALIIVAGIGMQATRIQKASIDVDAARSTCIACHEKQHIAIKQVDAWMDSKHALMGIGCSACHLAEEGDFDAFKCPQSDMLIALHPTPGDCGQCHDQQVSEFANSKHAHQFWLIKNADRAVFENPISARHGCEQCHNISNLWPDASIGECDACHAKHSFSKAVARQPETCGECHLGPDHPHIEIYLESKHGNLFKAKGKNWDMGYSTQNNESTPIEAPVCVTCHMDGNEAQPMTHNVSARLAWESQMTWSFRTVWDNENLGSWQDKRQRMEAICAGCHAPRFYKTYLLTADLVNLQYNEIRRQFVYWTKKLTKNGLISRLEENGRFYSDPVLNGWDEDPEHLMYYGWHHEGRRFRHGAEMMGADYTQWHGIWEVQKDLIELIKWAAEHGDTEAKKITASTSPSKFTTYTLYDFPGTAWGINTHANITPYLYQAYPDYWDRVYANVEAAYKQGLLAKDQWAMWQERFENKSYYLGTQFTQSTDSLFQKYEKMNDYDLEQMNEQVVDFKLPGVPFFKR